ncbi:2-succinyl-6-hydroxy-2,4-cyclohexadiene-1-carboxylate synthase [Lactococcus allomyrinae]|uniref:Putative 2-succinyl-6-hydroxy-2,4-cyclohexadiene-1-carboxylate synthase n=1 Tax=Lactococcus allomyrinae TaxID=2419773 RepID=A0A387BN00_9LACT|nr:2-succinyl-6-hydroxy-2,4-cyclohexadiene-1-carboxylate synthase [Lactococcus allomyrinae]AYF99900.1 2-succinyl-6-hydroxy-2,4-cyclohexadiene-1-carboxylate synthase [Lactococcus allomyrinae]
MNFTEQIFEIDGLKYAVKSHGVGKPLFALHGFSEDSSTWDLLDISGYQIFSIDLIGHGNSSKPTELTAYSLENLLTALHQLFCQLADGKSFSLLGYSMGGRIALRYCLAYPLAPVEHLILESTGSGLATELEREQRRISDETLAQKILTNGSSWFADFWGNLALFDSQKKLSADLQKQIWQRRTANAPHSLANTLRATGQGQLEDVSDHIDEINADILYLSGALDTKYTQIARETFAPHPHIKTVNIENVGHNIHLENPEIYNKILTEYLCYNEEE